MTPSRRAAPDQQETRRDERQQRGEAGRARGFAAGEPPDVGGRDDGDRGIRADVQVPAAAHERVEEQRADGGVEAGDGGEAGQLAVGEALRDEDGPHGEPGQQVGAQPRHAVVPQPGHAGQETGEPPWAPVPGALIPRPGGRGRRTSPVRPARRRGTGAALPPALPAAPGRPRRRSRATRRRRSAAQAAVAPWRSTLSPTVSATTSTISSAAGGPSSSSSSAKTMDARPRGPNQPT